MVGEAEMFRKFFFSSTILYTAVLALSVAQMTSPSLNILIKKLEST